MTAIHYCQVAVRIAWPVLGSCRITRQNMGNRWIRLSSAPGVSSLPIPVSYTSQVGYRQEKMNLQNQTAVEEPTWNDAIDASAA